MEIWRRGTSTLTDILSAIQAGVKRMLLLLVGGETVFASKYLRVSPLQDVGLWNWHPRDWINLRSCSS